MNIMQNIENINEIPQGIIRALTDKSTSVRHAGTKELASFICMNVDYRYEENLINFINLFNSHFPDKTSITFRRAILLGYGVIASIKKPNEKDKMSNDNQWINLIIQPLLSSFKDPDTKIIIDSANTLIKIIKIHHNTVLRYFNEFFEGLLTLTVNPDQDVRNLSNSLDEVLKEIIHKSISFLIERSQIESSNQVSINFEKGDQIKNYNFNIDDLLQKLLDKIRANHPAIRILIVSWITFLDSIPEIKLMNKIFDFLPGLFNMLCDKTKDVNQSADKCLKDFLFEIENVFEKLDKETTNKILEIVIDQCKTMQDASKQIGFDWLLKFLKKYNSLLNTLSFKNIRYHNKYYKKLVDSKDRLSNVVNRRGNIILNEDKVDKKALTQSFNGQSEKNSNFKKDKLFLLEEEKSTVKRESDEYTVNKNYSSANNFFYNEKRKENNLEKRTPIYFENQNNFKNDEEYRNSAITSLENINENQESESQDHINGRIIHSISVNSNFNNYPHEILQIYSKIPFYLFPKILDAIFYNFNSINKLIFEKCDECNNILYNMIDLFTESKDLNIKNFENIIRNYFDSKNSVEKLLKWIQKLFDKFGDEMFSNIEMFIEKFTVLLTDSDEKIFENVLDILCKISNFNENYTENILFKIMEKLCSNRNLLNSKGLLILNKLCSLISVTKVYLHISDVLLKFEDIDFISSMINILDIFLLTYKETEELRTLLRKLKRKNNSSNSQVKDFFFKLYKTWCFNPISLLILCIISEHFELSYNLILKFPEIRLDEDYIIQLSKLVQLLESSLFNNIRVLMLEPAKNIYLIKTLYGILMLLPQGKAYNALSKRLKSIDMLIQLDNDFLYQTQHNINEKEELKIYLDIFNETQAILMQKKDKIEIFNQ